MRAIRVALALAAVAVVAGAAPAAAQAATADVRVGDFFFRPGQLRIDLGDTVEWRVLRGSPHTVTSRRGSPERFDSETLRPGERFSRTFDEPGRYPYLCTLHPWMRGVVQVGSDTGGPRIGRVRARAGRRVVRVAFGLSEPARVRAAVAPARRPRRVVRRTRPRRLDAGRRALRMRTRGLRRGRYRVTLIARDADGNVARARAAFRLRR